MRRLAVRSTQSHRLLCAAIAASVGLAAMSSSAEAAVKTWSGATSTAWGTAGNWDSLPANDTTTDTASFNLTTYANKNPVVTTNSIAGISIGASSGTGASATTLALTGTQLSIGASGITMASGASVSSIAPTTIVTGAAQTWSNASANALTIGTTTGGAIDTTSGQIALSSSAAGAINVNYASGSTTFSTITASSTGGIALNNVGSGTTTVNGAVTIGTGGLTVNGMVLMNGLVNNSGSTGLVSTTVGTRATIEYAAASGTETEGNLSTSNKGGLTIQTDAGSETLSFAGLNTHVGGSTLNLIIGAGSTIKIGSATTTTAIAGGTYLTTGTGSSTKYVATTSGVVSGFVGSSVANANAIGTAATNYELSNNGTDTITTASRTGNSIRYSGTGLTLNTNGNALLLNGILNAGSGALVINGTGTAGVGIGSANDLVLNAASGDIEFTGQYNYATSTGQTITTAGGNKVMFNQINNSGTGTLTMVNGSTAANAGNLIIGSSQALNFNITSSGTVSVFNVISDNSAGASSVSLTGGASGILTLNNANIYSGGTTVSAGLLNASIAGVAGVSGPLGTGITTINSGGKIRATVANALLGPSSIRLNGGTLAGFGTASTTYGGDVSVLAASTVLNERSSASGGVNDTFGTLAIGSSTLNVTNTSNSNSGTSTVTFGATTLSGNPTFNVAKTGVAAMAMVLGQIDNGGSARNISLTGDGSLTLGNLVGSGNFTFDSTNTTQGITSGGTAGTTTGVITVNTGVLKIAAVADINTPSSLGQGSVGSTTATSASDLILNNNATLSYIGGTATTTNRNFTLGGANATLDNSSATTAANVSFTSALDVVFATAVNHTLTFSGTQANASPGNLFGLRITDVDGTHPTSVAKSGATVWSLTNTNIYTGGTTISGGTLRATNAGAFGSGTITLTDTGVAFLDAAATFSNNNFELGGGAGTPLILLGQSGTTLGTSSTVIHLNGAASIAASLPGTAQPSTVNAMITGTGPLTLGNGGVQQGLMTWGNHGNSYTGSTTFLGNNSGSSSGSSNARAEWIWNATDIVPDSSNVSLIGGTLSTTSLSLNGFNEVMGALNGSGSAAYATRIVRNNSAGSDSTLTVGSGGGSGNYVGLINDGSTKKLNIVKTGSGTQTIAGGLTYTGSTTVNGGTLNLDFNQIATSASWATNSPSATYVAPTNYLSTSTSLTLSDGGTFAVTGRGDSTFSGTIVLATPSSRTFSWTVPAATLAQLAVGQRVDGANSVNIGVNSGTYIVKIDTTAGLVYLNNAPTNTNGVTTTLDVTAASAGSQSQTFSSITLAGDGALEADSPSLSGSPLTLNATSTMITATGASRTLTLKGNGIGLLTPNITDGAANQTSLTKSGTGTWSLTNAANGFTGNTTVTGGTLKLVAASNNIASSAAIIVGDSLANNGAKLDVTGVSGGFVLGGTQTLGGHGTVVGNVTTSDGSAIAPGNSIGTTTYQGNLSLVSGTILNYDLDAPGNSDLAAVTGNLDFSTGAGSIHVNLTDAGNMAEGTYKLFTYGSLIGGNGNFSDTLVVDSSSLAGKTYTFSNTGLSNGEVDLVIGAGVGVPEPASVAILAVGAIGLLARRRRTV